MNMSGVYGIVHVASGKSYVGSSVNIAKRCSLHLKNLNAGKHVNRLLQRAWNKYGEAAFEVLEIEQCPPEHLVKAEQYWIDTLGSADLSKGYNLAPKANSTLGLRWSARSRRNMALRVSKYFSDPENRRKQSERIKAFARQNPDFYIRLGKAAAEVICGTKRSDATKKKMSEARRLAWAQYTPEERAAACAISAANLAARNRTPWTD